MRLTRHAANRRRLYRVGLDEIELMVRTGRTLEADTRANRRLAGTSADGRDFIIVIALDNPELVITLIEQRS